MRVIALLTLPVAVAGYFARQLWQMMVLATVLSVVVTTAGLLVSCAPDLPAGATTIVPAGAAYLIAVIAMAVFKRRRPAELRADT